jgi:hypothetical protein
MNLFLLVLWLAIIAFGLSLRYGVGRTLLDSALPFLIAAPVAYLLLRWFQIFWPAQQQEKTAREKAIAGIWIVLVALNFVSMGCGLFQPWVSQTAWDLLSALATLSLGMMLTLLSNRLLAGRWLVKPPSAD